jgi:hypothetical protein
LQILHMRQNDCYGAIEPGWAGINPASSLCPKAQTTLKQWIAASLLPWQAVCYSHGRPFATTSILENQ